MSQAIDSRPYVFIGSSREGLPVARRIETAVSDYAITKSWRNDVFLPGDNTLEALISSSGLFDFAIIIMSGDDMLTKRGEEHLTSRDNVIFELGLFMGKIGKSRTFIVREKNKNLNLPSDLAGITTLSYENHQMHGLITNPASNEIIDIIQKLGVSEDNARSRIGEATRGIEGASSAMTEMMREMIKSRIIEMEIVSRLMPAVDREKARDNIKQLEIALKNSFKNQ